MMESRMHRPNSRFFVAWCAAFALIAMPAFGQFDFGDFKVVPDLQQFNSGPPSANLKVSAGIRKELGSQFGVLEITATMNKDWHVYSLTQPAGGPMKSTIKLDPSDKYRLLGSFAPDQPPYVHFIDVFNLDGEEFSGRVAWSAPIEILGSANDIAIGGFVEGQVCADGGACIPFDEKETRFAARVTGELSSSESGALRGVRLSGTHSPVRSWLSTNSAKPGETVQMYVAFNPDPDWHVYAYAERPASMFQKPTLYQAELPAGWTTGPITSASPIISEEGLPNDPPIRYYSGAATITIPIIIPEDATEGVQSLSGHVAFQTCATQCDRPTAIAWQTQLNVTSATSQFDTGSKLGVVTFDGQPRDYDDVLALVQTADSENGASELPDVDSMPSVDPVGEGAEDALPDVAVVGGGQGLAGIEFDESTEEQAETNLLSILGAAFLGGFILNFMPCVLPVIGLKILSFVEQAGSDRLKVFKLNAWYALGMLAIFWVLAVLAAAPALGLSENGFGWGEQFNYQGFAISLVCVVFAMALSFLGVWEIPIPGFATSTKASELSTQEGYSGAFFKGAVTTVLATPCSAPGLAAAYAFAVNSRSVTMPFLIFTVMGLGMAIPYLLIGAFPSLIRFLPKPGAWMDTFKQMMGFVLLATVIFLMQNVTFTNLLPTIAMLFGIWFACWWIGSVPFTAEPDKRMRAWGISVVIVLLATAISFGRHVDAFGMTFSGLLGKAETKYGFNIDRAVSERGVSSATDTDGGTKLVAHGANSLPWEPYSTRALDELVKDGNTVLVDFTADW